MTPKQAYFHSLSVLNGCGIDEVEFKALCLVCTASGLKNSEFEQKKDCDICDAIILEKFLNRMKNGEPLQYVLGKWDFYNSEFFVGAGVLIPRPETEELAELAVNFAKRYSHPVIFDLCAGSGCIGRTVADLCPKSSVYCIEKSDKAFDYLVKNCSDRSNINLIKADICAEIDYDLPCADIIVSNPPYIKTEDISALQKELSFEPSVALDGGADGMDFYRVINDVWSNKLNSAGVLLLEIGNDQGKIIKPILNCFSNTTIKKDLYGNDRIVVAKK